MAGLANRVTRTRVFFGISGAIAPLVGAVLSSVETEADTQAIVHSSWVMFALGFAIMGLYLVAVRLAPTRMSIPASWAVPFAAAVFVAAFTLNAIFSQAGRETFLSFIGGALVAIATLASRAFLTGEDS